MPDRERLGPLDSDPGADIGQRQVVVENLPAEWNSDDVPRDEAAAQNEEPTEPEGADIGEPAPGFAVDLGEPPGDGLTPLG